MHVVGPREVLDRPLVSALPGKGLGQQPLGGSLPAPRRVVVFLERGNRPAERLFGCLIGSLRQLNSAQFQAALDRQAIFGADMFHQHADGLAAATLGFDQFSGLPQLGGGGGSHGDLGMIGGVPSESAFVLAGPIQKRACIAVLATNYAHLGNRGRRDAVLAPVGANLTAQVRHNSSALCDHWRASSWLPALRRQPIKAVASLIWSVSILFFAATFQAAQ